MLWKLWTLWISFAMVLLVYPAPWTRLRPQAQLEQANGSGSSRTGWIDEEGIPKFFEIPETLEIPKKHCGESRCLATPKMWIFLFVIPLSRWHTLVPFHFEVAASNTWLFMEEIRKPNQLKYIKKSLLIMEYSKPSQLLQPSFSSFFMTVVYIYIQLVDFFHPTVLEAESLLRFGEGEASRPLMATRNPPKLTVWMVRN